MSLYDTRFKENYVPKFLQKKKDVRERKLALCKLYSRGSWIENRRKSVPDESEICEKTVSPLQKGGERKGGGTVICGDIQQCSLHLLF